MKYRKPYIHSGESVFDPSILDAARLLHNSISSLRAYEYWREGDLVRTQRLIVQDRAEELTYLVYGQLLPSGD